MAWTWIKSGNGYALVDSDAPGATPTAVLAKENGKWVLASAAGEVVMPSKPTFDHAERALIAQGVMSPKPPSETKPPKGKPKKAPGEKKPSKGTPKPPVGETKPPKGKPFKSPDLKRLVRGAGSFVGNPATTLRQSREHAVALASQKGVVEVRSQMQRAHDELAKRLDAALATGPGEDSFTAVQLQTTLAQVKAVLADLQPGLEGTVVANGKLAATAAAEDAVKYLRESEHKYRGIARPIPIQQAKVLDRAIMGSESSLLNRLQGDPKAGPGILQRYGDAVIQKFEERLQQRMIQGKSVAEVRQDLIKDSEFLQGAPLSWAERIVRTEVMGAHARANFEAIQEVDKQTDGGMLKILCATFDGRTGADSYAVHGQIRRANEPFEDWHHQYMTPPNRPNDREIVVAHFIEWPIPDELHPKSDAEVAARWAELGNKRALPPRPRMTTVPLDQIGKRSNEKKKPEPESAPVDTTAEPLQER